MASVTAMNNQVGTMKDTALDELVAALDNEDGSAGSRTEAILRAEDKLQSVIALSDTLKQKGYKYA